jgi:hypothetical protein
MVKLQEAENQIIVDYEVYARRPNDVDLLIPAIATHQAKLGRVPRLAAADAAFYSSRNEAAAKAMGVKRVCIPNRATKSLERKREQKKHGSATARNGAPDARDGSAGPRSRSPHHCWPHSAPWPWPHSAHLSVRNIGWRPRQKIPL